MSIWDYQPLPNQNQISVLDFWISRQQLLDRLALFATDGRQTVPGFDNVNSCPRGAGCCRPARLRCRRTLHGNRPEDLQPIPLVLAGIQVVQEQPPTPGLHDLHACADGAIAEEPMADAAPMEH